MVVRRRRLTVPRTAGFGIEALRCVRVLSALVPSRPAGAQEGADAMVGAAHGVRAGGLESAQCLVGCSLELVAERHVALHDGVVAAMRTAFQTNVGLAVCAVQDEQAGVCLTGEIGEPGDESADRSGGGGDGNVHFKTFLGANPS